MTSLPFRMRGVFTGFVDLEGIARLEDKDLCLEFSVNTVFTRYLKTRPKEVRIALDDLEEAAFKKRLCIGMLQLRARRLNSFSQIPGNEGSVLRLRCRPEHWELAREMASRLSMRTVQQQLRDLVAETDRAGRVLDQPADASASGSSKSDLRVKQSNG